MSDHMAPQRLELSRRDERGQGVPPSRRQASARAQQDVPDYGMVEYPPPAYPDQLDNDYAPQGQYSPGYPAGSALPVDVPPSPSRLDRTTYNLPPLPARQTVDVSGSGYRERSAPVPPASVPEPARIEPVQPEPVAARKPSNGRSPGSSRSASGEAGPSQPDHAVTADGTPIDPALSAHYRELRDQLMHTIQLYSDEWRLGGIRTSENKLVAYLIPRQKKINLKDAIHRREVLVITVDSRGNTDVKEPRKRGFVSRLSEKLFGE